MNRESKLWIVASALVLGALFAALMSLQQGCGGPEIGVKEYCNSTCGQSALCLIRRDPSLVGGVGLDTDFSVCKRTCQDVGLLRERQGEVVDWAAAMDAADAMTCDEWLTHIGI